MYKLARATGHVILLFESAFMQQEEHVLLCKESFEATTTVRKPKNESSLLRTAFHLHLDAKTERETRRAFEKHPQHTSPREVSCAPSTSAPSQPRRIERAVPARHAGPVANPRYVSRLSFEPQDLFPPSGGHSWPNRPCWQWGNSSLANSTTSLWHETSNPADGTQTEKFSSGRL